MSEGTVITIQPGNMPDGTYDPQLPLPYPYHVEAATGEVGRQDFWKGDPARVIGFQAGPDVQTVDLFWEDAAADPERIVGMFPVLLDTSKGEGTVYSRMCPITSVHSSKSDREAGA